MNRDKRTGMAAALALVTFYFLFLPAPSKPSGSGQSTAAEETIIRQLNEQYVEAFLKSDVGWYERHLADDFICITSSGAVLDKQAFLRNTAKGTEVTVYHLDQVAVRLFGDTALVQATGLFTRKDGSSGKSRYIDVYVRMGREWKVVSAQITRVAEP